MADTTPYGAWPSPVSAASLAESGIGMGDLRVAGGRLYWLESRPTEGGRMVLMTLGDDGPRQLTPPEYNLRTRVHEYGGAPYAVIGEDIWFTNFRDQKLYRQHGEATQAITPDGYRYADFVAAPGSGLIAVREDHTDPADVKNAIVRLSGQVGDPGDVLFGDSDFVAYPRVSPDGTRLAWIAWDHPAMPWDATRLYTASLGPAGVSGLQVVAGGADTSVIEPQWRGDGSLFHISDEGGFWNLYVLRNAREPVTDRRAEFAGPLWGLGQANYALLSDSRVVASFSEDGRDRLAVIAGGETRVLDLPFTGLRGLQALSDDKVAMIAASAAETSALIAVDVCTGAHEVLHRASPNWLDRRYVATAQPIRFPSVAGEAYGLYYAPTNADVSAPAGPPPLIVQAHGGPTGQASSAFNLGIQYWTSRGFAVVDVDYGGSSGYGRDYRRRLNGAWGIVDVQDVIAAARHLISEGLADPERIAIHGGSAGGFTVLAALSQSDVFKAGGNFYGVSDLEALARDTHKFESRYLDGLIGPWPEAKAIYDARSPIQHLGGFTAPLIILQGADDPIVPPNQSRMIRDALKAKGVPVAYIEFEKEGHGFRRAANQIRAKEAELAFYGAVFGFTPADDLPPLEIDGL